MKKLTVFTLVAVMFFAGAARAQDKAAETKPAAAPAPETKEAKEAREARYKDIKELLKVTGSADMGTQIAYQIVMSLKQQYPEVTDAQWKEYIGKMNTSELSEKVLPVYDKYFTNSEIKDIVKFYNSEIGKKMIKTMPMMMQESMAVGQEWGDSKAEALIKELSALKEAKEKADKKDAPAVEKKDVPPAGNKEAPNK